MSNRPLTRRAKAQAAAAIAATAQPATREIEPKPATKRKVIAGKRKAPTRKKAEPASQKKRKIEINEDIKNSVLRVLRRDMWMEVIKFLDRNDIFINIAAVNSFFYHMVSSIFSTLDHMSMKIGKGGPPGNYFNKSNANILNRDIGEKFEVLAKFSNLKHLRYRSPPTLHFRGGVRKPPLTYLPRMPWAGQLISIDINWDSYNANVYKAAFDTLQNLQILKLRLMLQFPMFLNYLFKRFVNPEGLEINAAPGLFGLVRNRDTDTRDRALSAGELLPIKHFQVKYCMPYNSQDTIPNLFEQLDSNNTIEYFQLSVPSYNSMNPIIAQPRFGMNKSLRVLKLCESFGFSQETASDFSTFLRFNNTLEHLEIYRNVMLAKNEFIQAISYNETLRSLILMPNHSVGDFRFELPAYLELVVAVANNKSIEVFKATTNGFLVQGPGVTRGFNRGFGLAQPGMEPEPLADIEQRLPAVYEAIDMLLRKPNLREVGLGIDATPHFAMETISELILQNIQNPDMSLRIVNGYQVREIFEGRISKMEVLNQHMQAIGYESAYSGVVNLGAVLLCKLLDTTTWNVQYIDVSRLSRVRSGGSGFYPGSFSLAFGHWGSQNLFLGNRDNSIRASQSFQFVDRQISVDELRGSNPDITAFGYHDGLSQNFTMVNVLLLHLIRGNPYITNFSMRQLDFPSISLALCNTLEALPSLHSLEVYNLNSPNAHKNQQILSNVLDTCMTLESLSIWDCNIEIMTNQEIIERLRDHYCLKRLSIQSQATFAFGMHQPNDPTINFKLPQIFHSTNIRHLKLTNFHLNQDQIELLLKGLANNEILKSICMDNLQINNTGHYYQTGFAAGNTYSSYWKARDRFAICLLESVVNKPFLKELDINFSDNYQPSDYVPKDKTVERFLEVLEQFLQTNLNLKVLNIPTPVSCTHLMRYSEIMIPYITRPDSILHTFNKYDMQQLRQGELDSLTLKFYYNNRDSREPGFTFRAPRRYQRAILNHTYGNFGSISTIMPVILSYIVKNCCSVLETIQFDNKKVKAEQLFGLSKKTSKSFDMSQLRLKQAPDVTFALNCLSAHKNLQELTIKSMKMYPVDMDVLRLNLPEMTSLQKFEFTNNSGYHMPDLSALFANKNIKFLDLTKTNIASFTIDERFYEELVRSNLEVINLSRIPIHRHQLMSSILGMQSLETLTLTNCEIDYGLLMDLSKRLKAGSPIHTLNMEGLEIERNAEKIIRKIGKLVINDQLKAVAVSNLRIDSKIFDQKSVKFDLGNNKMTVLDLILLELCISSRKKPWKFTQLSFSGNSSLLSHSRSFPHFFTILAHMPKLYKLEIQGCGLEDQLDLGSFFTRFPHHIKEVKIGNSYKKQQLIDIIQSAHESENRPQIIDLSPVRVASFRTAIHDALRSTSEEFYRIKNGQLVMHSKRQNK